jgi:putative MATE family efflux protein
MAAFIKKYVGDKDFYLRVLKISLPLVIQQLLLNTFSVIDSIMVGSIYRGVAGVGIGSQISMVVMTIVFGINTGMGIYIAQFFGAKQKDNLKRTFALGTSLSTFFLVLVSALIIIFPGFFVGIFSSDPEVTTLAISYIRIAAFSYLMNGLTFGFAVAYRNIQKTKTPLYISFISSGLNILLNYLLIYGIGPFPELGVQGAAIATVISVGAGFIAHIIYGYASHQPFMPTLKSYQQALKVDFMKPLLRRMLPLMINELFFSIGTSIYVIFINNLGSDAYEGYRIAENINNVIVSMIVGMSISVQALIGESLGRKDVDQANKYANWFLFLGFILAIFVGGIALIFAPLFVSLFNNSSEVVNSNAIKVMQVYSLKLFLRVFIVLMYAAFRAGGDSKYVMFIDSGIVWMVGIPVALIASKLLNITDVGIFFLILQIEGLARIIIGMPHYQKRTWLKNLTEEVNMEEEKDGL